ncbi:hypothetical protein Trydic_g21540 [Trypoxylus dichotomus]
MKKQLRLQALMGEIEDMSDDDPYCNDSDSNPDYKEAASRDNEPDEDDESTESAGKNCKVDEERPVQTELDGEYEESSDLKTTETGPPKQ